ncbi:hydantoinase/oxoprolinase family protein [Egibacter rhizosphaerae]|uniref:Hydantoinase/oxoprolinase family protein n=1 Tax=Egibacter rhizosphaerae TaxID=1670831 RepID=A0A411YL31_9ACTN|nr:hydantoinase/oxoprolinase family protein [Egibacter rhizosphaerae]
MGLLGPGGGGPRGDDAGGGGPRGDDAGGGGPRGDDAGGGGPRGEDAGGGGRGEAVSAVSHGTTVATNALLSEEFEGLGFLTTEGFRHVLEIARQSVPDGYGNSYFWVKPDRIVPVDLVREVGGRLAVAGTEVRPLDEDDIRKAARTFARRGVDAVGICFIHAYANGAHEQRAREVLLEEHPDCHVSLSSEVLREYREYERSMTTLVDAFVKPRVTAYLAGIADRLETLTSSARSVPFYVMKSNGGVMSATELGRQPITTILSGPAAGALGAGVVSRGAGFDRVLTLDGGGTSTDVAVVTDGEPGITTEGQVGRFPTKVPMVDVETVGTGGGSIAWVPPEGGLKVGPRSAGADPGPLCYGQGGTEPTVTDCHLVLGRIPPALLGGEIELDAEAARRGIEGLAAQVGPSLAGATDAQGLDLERAADGVLEIAAWNQANAIRQVTIKRGHDVRDFVMCAFGGSGPLLACRLVDVLRLRAALVPPDPGNLSAFGLLTVDVRNDDVQTWVRRHAEVDTPDGRAELAERFAELERGAGRALELEGFGAEEHDYRRSVDLRYFGQAYEVRVPAPAGPVDDAFPERVLAAFHDAHEQLYGYCYRHDPNKIVEWVNVRVAGVGPIETPPLAAAEPGDGDPSAAVTGKRAMYTSQAAGGDGWRQATLYDRTALRAGDIVPGPAVVEEFGSTVPLLPGFTARVDEHANLLVTKDAR